MKFERVKLHMICVSLALLMVAGSFRFLFGITQNFYFVLIGILLLTLVLKMIYPIKIYKELAIYITIGIAFILWLIVSTSWTISEKQWKEDFILLLGLLSLMLLISLQLNYRIVELFKIYLVIFCGLVALLVIYYSRGVFGISGYGTLVNEFYLTAANPIAAGLIISVVQFYLCDSKRKFWLLSSILFMISLGVSLSRGALVFSLLAIISLIFFMAKVNINNIKIKQKHLKRYLFFVIPIFFGLIYFSVNVERTKFRLIRMFSMEKEFLVGGRGLLWENAFNGIANSPLFGYGLGGNGLIVGKEFSYPHNFLFQIGLDGGIVALVLGVIFLIFPIYVYYKSRTDNGRDINSLMLLLLYALYFFHYSKSSNFYTARNLVILGVLLVFWISFKNRFKRRGDFRQNCKKINI